MDSYSLAADTCNAPNGQAIFFPCSSGQVPAGAELPRKINIFRRDTEISFGEEQPT